MSRSAAKSHYITPIGTDGVPLTTQKDGGKFTLTANTTYYYVMGGAGSAFLSVTLTGYTSGLIITSATIQDTDHGPFVTDQSATVGEWIPEGSSTSVVGFTGTGWSAASGVVAAAGSGLGGARWNIESDGAYRTRLTVVVGATGGDALVSMYEKD
jgi:hypothetical protein